MGDVEQKTRSYRAFISYSHADEQWGGWLHRALEGYRVPKGIIGRETDVGAAPEKLTPVFRDRYDLPAAGNLSDKIQDALEHSLFQIVICSPRSAKSHWVNEEVKLFKKIHGNDRTLAVIVDGEPFASDMPGREDEECFPPALRVSADDNGDLTEIRTEPLAADARPDKDGKSLALSKLAAGLLGVNLDDLVQRETQRRARNARRVAGVSGVIAASMGLLAVVALNARNQAELSRIEADNMRGEAENLIQFMLSDFRDNLEKVGRLDMLDSVGDRALEYYEGQDPEALDADALGRRSQAMLLVGEIDQRRNDLDAALASYETAADATSELLRRDPKNPDRIFEHAQSVFWIGYVYEKRREIDQAEEYLQEYLSLAEQLVAIDPENPKWQLELAYATHNLATLAFRRQNFQEALEFFKGATNAKKALLGNNPDDLNVKKSYANALSWQAWTDMALGNFNAAVVLLKQEVSLYEKLLEVDAEDFSVLTELVTAYRRLGQSKVALGNIEDAHISFASARDTSQRLLKRDRNTATFQLNFSHTIREQSELSILSNDKEKAIGHATSAIEHASLVQKKDPTHTDSTFALMRALGLYVSIEPDGKIAQNLNGIIQQSRRIYLTNGLEPISVGLRSLANYYESIGDHERAKTTRAEAIAMLENEKSKLTTLTKLTLFDLYMDADDTEKARELGGELMATDLRHPRFMASMAELQ